ncbi:hypothetical protein FG05_30407 [Fusarium graminearum]|nr:hypothetical protein FG05_30407 [Fusarium graminearum]
MPNEKPLTVYWARCYRRTLYSRASLSFTFTLVLIYALQKTDHIEEHFRICPEVTDHSCDETSMDICSD